MSSDGPAGPLGPTGSTSVVGAVGPKPPHHPDYHNHVFRGVPTAAPVAPLPSSVAALVAGEAAGETHTHAVAVEA